MRWLGSHHGVLQIQLRHSFREAVQDLCPEGFGGDIEYVFDQDGLIFRMRSDGIKGVAKVPIERRFIEEILDLRFVPQDKVRRLVQHGLDAMMEATLP